MIRHAGGWNMHSRSAEEGFKEKRGYFVHYRLNEETLAAWRDEINELLDPENGVGENMRGL